MDIAGEHVDPINFTIDSVTTRPRRVSTESMVRPLRQLDARGGGGGGTRHPTLLGPQDTGSLYLCPLCLCLRLNSIRMDSVSRGIH